MIPVSNIYFLFRDASIWKLIILIKIHFNHLVGGDVCIDVKD